MTHWELVEGQMFRQRYHQCYCVQVRPNLCIIRTSNTHFTHLFILGVLYFRCMKRTIYVIAAKTDPSGSVMCIMSIADFIVTLVAVSISLTFLWLLDKLRLSRLPTTSIHLLHCTSIVEHWCSLSVVSMLTLLSQIWLSPNFTFSVELATYCGIEWLQFFAIIFLQFESRPDLINLLCRWTAW